MNILYVENHAVFVATVTRQFLSKHSVTVVPSLSSARQALANAVFDVLLVDYDLDDGKGDQLLKEIQAAGKRVVVIGVSSHNEGNAALLKAGAVSICNKIHFDRIQSVIESVTPLAAGANSPRNNLLWWVIPGVLAGMPMPFIHPDRRLNLGGPLTAFDDELQTLCSAGIHAVVSLLNIPSDKAIYESAGFAFLCLPLPDGGAPTRSQATEFVQFVSGQRKAQRPVAVHCEAGLGRTGTMLATYLIFQGESADGAVNRIRALEPAAIETPRQLQFLKEYAQDTLL